MRIREYAGPLGVLAAAGIGFSLLCSVSALAVNDLNTHVRATIQPLNIVDLAIDNLSTSAALTEQAVTAFVPTPTVFPSHTVSLTPLTADTVTVPPSPTRPQQTPTRRARPAVTVPFLPTQTRTPQPTSTKTLAPTSTNTAIPPTNTPLTPTDTSIPPTDTQSPETATSIHPTDTEAPPATQTESFPTEVPTQSSNSTEIALP